jgi:hypothetical protein
MSAWTRGTDAVNVEVRGPRGTPLFVVNVSSQGPMTTVPAGFAADGA